MILLSYHDIDMKYKLLKMLYLFDITQESCPDYFSSASAFNENCHISVFHLFNGVLLWRAICWFVIVI
jgi:hypothetical protein